jgi:hypothetical protein
VYPTIHLKSGIKLANIEPPRVPHFRRSRWPRNPATGLSRPGSVREWDSSSRTQGQNSRTHVAVRMLVFSGHVQTRSSHCTTWNHFYKILPFPAYTLTHLRSLTVPELRGSGPINSKSSIINSHFQHNYRVAENGSNRHRQIPNAATRDPVDFWFY